MLGIATIANSWLECFWTAGVSITNVSVINYFQRSSVPVRREVENSCPCRVHRFCRLYWHAHTVGNSTSTLKARSKILSAAVSYWRCFYGAFAGRVESRTRPRLIAWNSCRSSTPASSVDDQKVLTAYRGERDAPRASTQREKLLFSSRASSLLAGRFLRKKHFQWTTRATTSRSASTLLTGSGAYVIYLRELRSYSVAATLQCTAHSGTFIHRNSKEAFKFRARHVVMSDEMDELVY
ncbi:hypothetical protein PUN28_004883 [Cardiocondyla obscurior]|uniref:Uncharacterized protein n=1 Tax=Cardiocondyla obscurior TaxID=286306 RepID=A0AAW2GDG2_9HYME